MGLLGKLFSNNKSNNDTPPDMNVKSRLSGDVMTLRTTNDEGYDKNQTLMVIGMLQSEYMSLENALANKRSGKDYRVPESTQLPELATVRRGGFEKNCVIQSIANLRNIIEETRTELEKAEF